MSFKTQTFVTEELYQGLINQKQMRRNTFISLFLIAVMPVITISSMLDASSTRSFWFDIFGLVSAIICILVLQLPRIMVRRGIRAAQKEGVLDTMLIVEFSGEGIVKNDTKVIPYRDVLAVLMTSDKYLLSSKGTQWTFVDKKTLELEEHKDEFEKFIEKKCPQARWTQAA